MSESSRMGVRRRIGPAPSSPGSSSTECLGGGPESSRRALSQGRCVMDEGELLPLEKRYRRLDEGELLGALTSGTYDRVYAAWDTQTGSTVAVKRQEVPNAVAA